METHTTAIGAAMYDGSTLPHPATKVWGCPPASSYSASLKPRVSAAMPVEPFMRYDTRQFSA